MANVFDNVKGVAHVVCESSLLKATEVGHILSMQCHKDLDNGSIVARGAFVEEQVFKTADYAAGQENWSRRTLINIAEAGFFSSDRTIAEYDNDIWHLGK